MTQFNAPTYDIARPTGQCAFTGRPLASGEHYISALVEAPLDETPATSSNILGFKRLDISSEAWAEGNRPEHLFSFWKSVVPQPNQKKKLFVDDGVLMDLLRRLADAGQQQRLAFRFVLALVLMRKKLLRYDGTQKRNDTVTIEATESAPSTTQVVEREWWIMTPKLDVTKGQFGKWNEDERIEVLDPRLDEAQIQQVTGQLNEILNAEL